MRQRPLFGDDGGYLPPGTTEVANTTGEPERVLGPDEVDIIRGEE